MQFNDYKITTQIRSLLVTRWVDLSRVDYGVTNGVVYMNGSLNHHLSRAERDNPDLAKASDVELVTVLERLVRSIHGVRDVVFKFSNLTKAGSKWKHR